MSITINPVNDAPVAEEQSVEVNEDESVHITLNGDDVETDPADFTYDIVRLYIIKLLANADTLRIGLEGAAESWHYSTWSGTSQEWLALADWESTLPENREAYTRRR